MFGDALLRLPFKAPWRSDSSVNRRIRSYATFCSYRGRWPAGNPPYDSEIGSIANRRMEAVFLEHSYRWLAMEGVLILVIPFERLHDCSGLLSSHFAGLTVLRMTDEDSVKYRQIAVLGLRRDVRGATVEQNKRQLQSVGLYRSFQTLPELQPGAWGHRYGLEVALMDADQVSETNCVRQPFSISDIGQNKATVLVNPRYDGGNREKGNNDDDKVHWRFNSLQVLREHGCKKFPQRRPGRRQIQVNRIGRQGKWYQ